jgi:hypothetical protein
MPAARDPRTTAIELGLYTTNAPIGAGDGQDHDRDGRDRGLTVFPPQLTVSPLSVASPEPFAEGSTTVTGRLLPVAAFAAAVIATQCTGDVLRSASN